MQNLEKNYTPIENFYPQKKYLDKLCNGYDSIYRTMIYTKKNEAKSFTESFNEIKKSIKAINDDSLLMENDVITNYLQSLLNKIKQKNPDIANKKFHLFTYRTSEPNATSYGNGIILYNLNMLAQLRNESEVAFILCHEISHEVKTHYIESIKKSHEISEDPEVKKEYKRLKNSKEFNILKSYENYLAKRIQRFTSKKRENELQADSLGLLLFHNAGFELNDAYKTMERLDSIDNQFYLDKIDFEKLFNSNKFTFNRNWLLPEDEDETIDGGNYINAKYPDSLKTHPDCKIRLQKMQQITFSDFPEKTIVDDFSKIKTIAEYEMLRVYLDESELSKGLYNCMQLLSLHPQNIYLKTNLAEYLYELYNSKAQHYISQVVDKNEPHLPESYKETINFSNNIKLDDLKNLTINYFTSNFQSEITDPYLAYVFTLIKTIDKPKDKKLELVLNYEKNFSKNIYTNKLKYKFYKK